MSRFTNLFQESTSTTVESVETSPVSDTSPKVEVEVEETTVEKVVPITKATKTTKKKKFTMD